MLFSAGCMWYVLALVFPPVQYGMPYLTPKEPIMCSVGKGAINYYISSY